MALTTRIEKTFKHGLRVEDVEEFFQDVRLELNMTPDELGSARFHAWTKDGVSGVSVSWES